jgi:penicillin-binding protein 1A
MSAEIAPNTVLSLPENKSASRRFLRSLWVPMALLLGLSAGAVTGVIAAYEMNYSRTANEVAALSTYRPSVVTKVYADDGETLIGEFALERRIPLKSSEIPDRMKNAILAIEDNRFYDHFGIDPIRIAGAGLKNLTEGTRQGGSTLTQQLAKNLFLTREQTFSRKFNEWVMALQIERYYTKDQILEMYANNTFFGAGAYGIEAASEVYFSKQAKDLTLAESAMLAGIPRAPSEYAPTTNPQRCKERRDLVLTQMANFGKITETEAAAAKAEPIKLSETAYYPSLQSRSSPNDYPVEQIRQELEDKYTTRVAQGGLTVYSTVNVDAQKKAMEVVQRRLRIYDRGRAKWQSDQYFALTAGNASALVPVKTIDANNYKVPSAGELNNYKHPDWFGNSFTPDEYVMGLIMSVDEQNNEAVARLGNYTAKIAKGQMGWGGRNPKDEFKPGYLAQFNIKKIDENAKTVEVELTQIPEVQAAMVTINVKNGEIVSMAGGYNFQLGKFNNATQALRQTGSAFKPYVYTAAVEWGLTPDSIVSGQAIRKWGWSPQNYDGSHSHGNVALKTALAKSYNVAAVHLLDMVGIQTGAQMVRRFGITVPMAPVLPSALGASEVPLIQMVSAYSAFPNKGVRMQPHLIRKVLDRDGNTLEEWQPTSYKVMNEYVAGTMVEMMQGVTRGGGTASGTNAGGHPLAGKTGTVNDHTDVWFVGYTPEYCTGVWMGNPERKESLGSGMTGGHGAAPYFSEFMSYFMKDKQRVSFFKTPKMPEDMKAIIEQRKREFSEAEALARSNGGGGGGGGSHSGGGGASRRRSSDDGGADTEDNSVPSLDTITLPPPEPRGNAGGDTDKPAPPKSGGDKPAPPAIVPNVKPKPESDKPPAPAGDKPAPPAGGTRPREAEPKKPAPPEPKKQGKKGNDEPGR